MTHAARNVLDRAGLDPELQGYYTLSGSPKYRFTNKLHELLGSNEAVKHFVGPLRTIGTNIIERAYEHSPFGLTRLMFEDSSQTPDILKRALAGTVATGTAAAVTPDNFVREHPMLSTIAAAAGGPMIGPIAAGMGWKSLRPSDEPDPTQTMPLTGIPLDNPLSRFTSMMHEPFRETPGAAAFSDITDAVNGRNLAAFPRNYFSRYTNFMRPIADLTDPSMDKYDLTSKDLPLTDQMFNRSKANVPFERRKLTLKDESLFTPQTDSESLFKPLFGQ